MFKKCNKKFRKVQPIDVEININWNVYTLNRIIYKQFKKK